QTGVVDLQVDGAAFDEDGLRHAFGLVGRFGRLDVAYGAAGQRRTVGVPLGRVVGELVVVPDDAQRGRLDGVGRRVVVDESVLNVVHAHRPERYPARAAGRGPFAPPAEHPGRASVRQPCGGARRSYRSGRTPSGEPQVRW